MAKKVVHKKAVEKAVLIRPKGDFKKILEERIGLGKELLTIQVAQVSRRLPGYGFNLYGDVVKPEYDEKQLKVFTTEFHKWSDFNKELLKQSFDIPDNEYLDTYTKRGIPYVMIGDEDMLKLYHEEINEKISYLESLIQQMPLLPSAEVSPARVAKPASCTTSKKVFIVHGHDNQTRTEAELLMTKLGFEPIVLFKQANMGATIIEKLERETKDICFAIVLYTKCDEGKAVEETVLKPRARQNVVFEHGMMCALLGRDHVVALVEEGVEIPGDLSGVVYITQDAVGKWKYDVAKEMRAIGLDADMNNIV